MQGTLLFEYAVIRVMPRVEREEFINVGVILYCPGKKFLQILFEISASRLCSFSADINLAEIHERLKAFETVCAGKTGTIGELPVASRFRWLTAARSTVVQCSPVHPGLCIDPQITLDRLFVKLVK